MLPLPNGCKHTPFTVHPKNWKASRAKVSIYWYAQCRFVDPEHLDVYPKGKPIRLKKGINWLKTAAERRTALESLIGETEALFLNGYNPIRESLLEASKPTESTLNAVNPTQVVLPGTPFISALKTALENSTNVKECIADMGSVLKSIESAATTLSFLNIPIGDIEVKHVKRCLDLCHKTNPKFSEKRYNKAKAYLSSLFRYLIQEGAAHGNMARAVNPLREEATKPLYFTEEEIARIKSHLWVYNRPFYNFMLMFYYSGGRIKELLSLQGKDVDIKEQTYTALVKKGKSRWVSRTIRNVAIPYWIEQLKDCGPYDFVFSKNLLPGAEQIDSHQVTRRWRTHVQKPLNIKTSFYKLKHLNTDRTLKAVGAKIAAGQNAHVSTKMVEEVYAYNEKKRIHETLKALDIEL